MNKVNQAIEFLNTTDWKVIRHRDQLALGIPTELCQAEYEDLLERRQRARNKIKA